MKLISVENMSKKFVVAHARSQNVVDAARNLLSRSEREDFWALKDITFDVEQGEALGIIGRNGAGKSTMLKLLTHIMEPTSGRIRTRGRISALIEVGAGFHPEMTGRENVYLNGAILGMKRAEIDRKFEEIVAFAEIEQFIDMPVKRYSSGMYARLGFAVAAHVEPEILLVDEVLSVGDERFQIKCQEHMSKLLLSGVTVLFVSHNLAAVTAMCRRSVVIKRGHCIFDGASDEAVKVLRRSMAPAASEVSDEGAGGDLPVYIRGARVLNGADEDVESVEVGAKLVIELMCHANTSLPGLNFGVEIRTGEGIVCYDVNSRMDNYLPDVESGDFNIRFEVDRCLLADGVYFVTAGIMDRQEAVHYHYYPQCTSFVVVDKAEYRGVARLGHRWHIYACKG